MLERKRCGGVTVSMATYIRSGKCRTFPSESSACGNRERVTWSPFSTAASLEGPNVKSRTAFAGRTYSEEEFLEKYFDPHSFSPVSLSVFRPVREFPKKDPLSFSKKVRTPHRGSAMESAETGPPSRPAAPTLTGCYLLVILSEPYTPEQKERIIEKVSKGEFETFFHYI